MKNVFILCFLFFFFSCSSTKPVQVLHSSSQSASSNNSDIVQNQFIAAQSVSLSENSLHSSVKDSSVLERVVISYDSDKPVNLVTGKPPVKSESFTTNKKISQKLTELSVSSTEKLNLKLDYIIEMKIQIDSLQSVISTLISKTDTEKSSFANWWKWLLAGLFFAVLAWVVWAYTPKCKR